MIDPAVLTHAERLQHDVHLRREEAYGVIRTLAKTGSPIRDRAPDRPQPKTSARQSRPHVRLSTGRPVSQYAGNECCAG
jgi:hypothetical protein